MMLAFFAYLLPFVSGGLVDPEGPKRLPHWNYTAANNSVLSESTLDTVSTPTHEDEPLSQLLTILVSDVTTETVFYQATTIYTTLESETTDMPHPAGTRFGSEDGRLPNTGTSVMDNDLSEEPDRNRDFSRRPHAEE